MANSNNSVDTSLKVKCVRNLICNLRETQVMIDVDLANLYGVETKVLNQAVKRNIARFPEGFRFQLNKIEKNELVTNCDRFTNLKHSTSLPFAFTEQGVAMLSTVLRSEVAIQISIRIINAFVEMRRHMAFSGNLLERIGTLEKRQISHEIKADERFDQLFNALEKENSKQTSGIFFDGQIFDSYVFVNDLIRQASSSIVLIDNYVDDSVLMQLSKRRKGVKAYILTKEINKQLAQDLKKHNAQYPPITICKFSCSHDRFFIFDDEIVYHLGASLKDLGKKWFAFSKMDKVGLVVMERIESILNPNSEEVSA